MASELVIGVAGGAIGSLLTYASRVIKVPAQVERNNRLMRAELEDLERWIWDSHRELSAELNGITNDMAARGLLNSGIHGGGRAAAKTRALQRYRDRRSRKDRAIAELIAQESVPHDVWRKLKRMNALDYNAGYDGSVVVEEWRQPVTRHGGEPIKVFDPSRPNVVEELVADLKLRPLEPPPA